MSSCFVFCFVFYIFPCQSTGGEFVLFCRCLAVYDGSFESGVVFDLDVVSFFSCVDACLFCDADIGGVCGVCLFPNGEVGIVHFLFPCIRTGGNISLQMDAAFFVPAVVGMAVLQAFYGEVVSCFYFYFLSACFASCDVQIFAAFHGQGFFSGDGASCMGHYFFFHISFGFSCADAYILESAYTKGGGNSCAFAPAVPFCCLPVSMAVLSLLSLLLSHVTRLSFSATAVPSSTCLLPAMVISPAEEIRAACRCISFPAVMVRLPSFPVTDAAPLFEIAVVCPCPFSSRWVPVVMRMSCPA